MSHTRLLTNEAGDGLDKVRDQRNVEEDVKVALQQSGYASIRNVEYELDGDELTLFGRVPSYYMKQIANTTVHKIEGVSIVYNLLEVA
jgi:osmotically-inducible protein OsmY